MSVLDIEDVKDYLKFAGTDAERDAKLQIFLDAAEAAVAARIGPLAVGETTVRVAGGGQFLMLPTYPVVSLTSVTPTLGTALTLEDLDLNLTTGVIAYNDGGWFGNATYDVVYDAGREDLPADIVLAIKELVRHFWTTQRGAGVPTGSPVSENLANTIPGSAWIFPMRVEQLLAPHEVPGIA